MEIKHRNKIRLAQHIQIHCGIDVSPDALFDIQCKRFHEYKRQFMNILGVIHRYKKLKEMSDSELASQTKKVVIFSGKSAPGYYIAKLIIKLINSAADVINEDPRTSEFLKLVFIPNYNVSLAEIIIPASDISQHISTAGTEASGTSNMKFVLNGGLIIGTVDGANIEIGEEVGKENIWLFGALTPEVEDIRHTQLFHPTVLDPELDFVVKSIQSGEFGEPYIFEPLLYLETLATIDEAYKDKAAWAKRSINAAASMGKFSSDRSIQDYAENIWKITPVSQPNDE
ncbi:Non-essential glycogen phosphorylase [Physocladia obscura]|uniref:Alpha-1,4 glucan phosphorylase n=1 Tax=Physocladia obscura TaxID=109957 RepID=A0AAD5XHT1_9FUNG|nr:Non-essential glycogen phosphorylase [Physocladia obscura]